MTGNCPPTREGDGLCKDLLSTSESDALKAFWKHCVGMTNHTPLCAPWTNIKILIFFHGAYKGVCFILPRSPSVDRWPDVSAFDASTDFTKNICPLQRARHWKLWMHCDMIALWNRNFNICSCWTQRCMIHHSNTMHAWSIAGPGPSLPLRLWSLKGNHLYAIEKKIYIIEDYVGSCIKDPWHTLLSSSLYVALQCDVHLSLCVYSSVIYIYIYIWLKSVC
jgi:hypothetical protein